MNKKKLIVILCSVGTAILLSACQALGPIDLKGESVPPALVLRNGTLITVTGEGPIPHGAVLVRDGLITAIGPENDIAIPEGATVIDVEGRTIMPGFIDAHTHILDRLDIEDGQINPFRLEVFLTRALSGGVTTFRDLNSSWDTHEEVEDLRNALATHGNQIPSVILSGPAIAHADGPFFKNFSGYGVTSIEEARQAAQSVIDDGADQIKIALHMRPNMILRGDPPEEVAPSLTLEQVGAITEVAHENGVWVTAHVIDPREVEICLAADVDELAHWPSSTQAIPDGILKALVDSRTPVVSTFMVTPPVEGDLRRFLDSGGILVYGSDAPGTGRIEYPSSEFGLMVRHGMTPMEIIQSATKNAAYALELDDLIGSLEPGKQADIIVVNGDPLEDINVIKEVVYVIKNGELVVGPEAE